MVNEALNEDGTMRQSQWYKIISPDFIEKAFQYAHEADPKAQLYYNDYSLENEAKRKGAVELMRKLKADGVPITGIGLQGHLHLDDADAKTEAETIEAFAALGLQVNVSELAVDILPRTTRSNSADVSMKAAGTADSNPYVNGLPDDMQQKLANRYAELFQVYIDHHKSMGRVTFWGVTDGGSWLNNFPTRGRTNYPLLFDRQGKPKPAFFAVLTARCGRRARIRCRASTFNTIQLRLLPITRRIQAINCPSLPAPEVLAGVPSSVRMRASLPAARSLPAIRSQG